MVELRTIDGNEFSRLLPAERLSLLPVSVEISANTKECRALARRFDLLALASLGAQLVVEAVDKRGMVLVKGRLEAKVTQACVVTLVSLPRHVTESFEAAFSAEVAEDSLGDQASESDEDLPEPLPTVGIDLGELVAQQLAVALDPYPRAADADAALAEIVPPHEEVKRKSPFEVLRSMKGKN